VPEYRPRRTSGGQPSQLAGSGRWWLKGAAELFDSRPSKAGTRPMYYNPAIWLVLRLIDLYTWVVIVAVVMSWLVAFGVINTFNPFARSVVQFLDAVTEPVFRQVRRVIPPIGGLDLSPLIVLILLEFLSYVIVYYSSYL
jgi:YggT family protein